MTINGIGHVYNVLPQGMNVSPSIFQTVMNDIFEEMISQEKLVVYLDDICISGKTFMECYENTREALERLKKANLKLNPDKCVFSHKR